MKHRVCLVGRSTPDFLSQLRYSHLIQAKVRFYRLFGGSDVFIPAEPRSCLVGRVSSSLLNLNFYRKVPTQINQKAIGSSDPD